MDTAGVVKVIAQPSGTGMVHASAVVLFILVDMRVYSVPVSTLFHLSESWIECYWHAKITLYHKQANNQGKLTD